MENEIWKDVEEFEENQILHKMQQVTINPKRRLTHFSRWMNFDNNFWLRASTLNAKTDY